MKSSNEIIAHIIKSPQNKKILQKRCFEKLKNLLPPHLKNAILFMYIKNQTLFFVLNHPGMKMEFNYKHNLIKDLLNKIKEIDKDCKDIEIKNIKSFVSNLIEPKKDSYISNIKYKERAKGDFEILAKDEKLKDIFKQIRDIIKQKHESNR